MTTDAAALFNAPAPAAAAPAAAPAAAAPAASPAVAAPAPAATPAAAPAPAAANWYDGFANPEVKTWTQAKGFKDPSAVAESAYNLEKLIGFDKAGRTLVIPKDDATPEEVRAFHTKLGVPEKAEDYKLPLPEGSDPKLTSTIQGWMHKAGATPKMAEALTKEFVAFSAAEKARQDDVLIANSNKALSETTAAWGKDAEQNMELAKRFSSAVVPDQVQMDDGSKVSRADFLEKVFNSTGATRAMVELFAKAGAGMGEHKMLTNNQAGMGDTSPAAAQAKIAALKADPAWTKAYLNGDKDKLAEMTRLNSLAFPAQ